VPLVFLDDLRYYTDYGFYRKHFRWSRRFSRGAKLLYHCFWSGPLSDYHELCLKSLLITQSPPFEVWFWLPAASIEAGGDRLAALGALPHVRVKAYVPEREATGTPLESRNDLLSPSRSVDMANAFRVLVQLKYGGVYFDMDVLFLKNLRPLLGVEFFAQWSNRPYGNNAVMHFRRESANVRSLAARGVALASFRSPHVLRLSDSAAWPAPVVMFPTFLFSPAWIAHDTGRPINSYCNRFDDFFESDARVTLGRFFQGAYTYHWHNGWNRPLKHRTIVGQLYRQVDVAFRRKYPAAITALRRGEHVRKSAAR
jgi:hypothetical protein